MNMQIRGAFVFVVIVAVSGAQTVEGELDQARSLAPAVWWAASTTPTMEPSMRPGSALIC
jgi:hypothetical protein